MKVIVAHNQNGPSCGICPLPETINYLGVRWLRPGMFLIGFHRIGAKINSMLVIGAQPHPACPPVAIPNTPGLSTPGSGGTPYPGRKAKKVNPFKLVS